MTTCCTEAIVRGMGVLFEAAFIDADGEPAEPANVELTVYYSVSGAPTHESYAMVFDGGSKFQYTWNSAVADAGVIFWSVRTDPSVQLAYASDGQFPLTSNLANRSAATPLP